MHQLLFWEDRNVVVQLMKLAPLEVRPTASYSPRIHRRNVRHILELKLANLWIAQKKLVHHLQQTAADWLPCIFIIVEQNENVSSPGQRSATPHLRGSGRQRIHQRTESTAPQCHRGSELQNARVNKQGTPTNCNYGKLLGCLCPSTHWLSSWGHACRELSNSGHKQMLQNANPSVCATECLLLS